MTISEPTPKAYGLYTPKVHAQFCSAHALREYPGDYRRLHGQNRQMETNTACVRYSEVAA